MKKPNLDNGQRSGSDSEHSYTVVARRYRPKSFGELVGQDNISQALGKAITSGRVGHAYLFTGARGVGKTSTARIFAKALNAPGGSSTNPDNSSDVCQAIDAGEDLDVIEIDGASNRSIEDIRQLRSNINVRPSRSQYKIYIIDEVHMLTTPAFNALLKTLEEPPEHVKFIFCTTDADKIPITVLSRCQRFDFAPVNVQSILHRLKEICALEGFEADEEALALLARRAAGSMRDSQSLLEQVISFSTGKITVDQVYSLLGLADEGRLLELIDALRNHASVQAIRLVEDAINHGSDPGQLAEQLLSYMRDLMAVAVGGGTELLKFANPAGFANLKAIADSWGLQTILATIQILDESLVRMRYSVQSRTLLELALVQTCQLQHLSSVASLLEAARQSGSGRTVAAKPNSQVLSEKKNNSPPATPACNLAQPVAPAPKASSFPAPAVNAQSATTYKPTAPTALASSPSVVRTGSSPSEVERVSEKPLEEHLPKNTATSAYVPIAEPELRDRDEPRPNPTAASSALQQWKEAVSQIDGMLANFALLAEEIEPIGSGKWVVEFPPGSQKSVDFCDAPENKRTLLACLQSYVGRDITLSFRVKPGPVVRALDIVKSSSAERSQRMREVAENPLVVRICKMLEGEILRVDPAQKSNDTLAGKHERASTVSSSGN